MFPRCLQPPRRLLGFILAACTPLCLSPPPAVAQNSPFKPYQHRAIYLYNFSKFTTWPADASFPTNAPLVVGILGDDPFGDAMSILRGKSIEGRPLVVKSFPQLSDVDRCDMLFLSESERKNWPEILKALEGTHILTVAEGEGFLEQGGMINLLMEKKTLTFEINQAAAEAAGLKIDSRLLRLAKRVKR